MPAGRPTKYKEEYCERVVEMSKEGCSWAEMASELDIDRTTLYDWAEKHPKFSTALSRAKVHEQAWWEKQGKSGMVGDKFNAAVWKKSMEARFRDDYTETRKVEGNFSILKDVDGVDVIAGDNGTSSD